MSINRGKDMAGRHWLLLLSAAVQLYEENVLIVDLLSRGAAEIKRVDLGNPNPSTEGSF